jgi:hypothetical protein
MKNLNLSLKVNKLIRILIYFLIACLGFIIGLSKGVEIFLVIIIFLIVDLIRDKAIDREKTKLFQEISTEKRVLQKKEECLLEEISQREKQIEDLYNRQQQEISHKQKEIEDLYNRRQQEISHKQKAIEILYNRRQLDIEQEFHRREVILEQLLKEKSLGFPSLAEAYANYLYLQDLKEADLLENKTKPAKKAAEKLKEIAKYRKAAERKCRTLEYQLEYYKNLIPGLDDSEEDEETSRVIEAELDDSKYLENPERRWLSESEYNNLSAIEKSQLALDRYWHHKKTKWELGKDYERYVGYQYEQKGCKVQYQGIIERFEDLGRDLIVINPAKDITIIQCKYWSRQKTIHEKHIFQLFGTFTAYKIDHPTSNVSATFITSTSLSERAKQFAKALEIKFIENYKLEKYPCIKCNTSERGKIYHLPFDQQYDKVIIEPEKGEFYASTVKEAEEKGFRRAKKWMGKQD